MNTRAHISFSQHSYNWYLSYFEALGSTCHTVHRYQLRYQAIILSQQIINKDPKITTWECTDIDLMYRLRRPTHVLCFMFISLRHRQVVQLIRFVAFKDLNCSRRCVCKKTFINGLIQINGSCNNLGARSAFNSLFFQTHLFRHLCCL